MAFWHTKDEQGITSAELVAALTKMDMMLSSDSHGPSWTKTAGAVDRNGKTVNPVDSAAVSWSVQGAAWYAANGYQPPQMPYRQICMALHAAMNRPMVTLQEHETGLNFDGMKEWLASAIEYAKNNDPWTPYLIQHPERLR